MFAFYTLLSIWSAHLFQVDTMSWVPIYRQHVEYATVLDSNAMSIILSRRNKLFITHDGGVTWEPHSEIQPDYLVRQIIAFDKCGESLIVNAVSARDSRALYLTLDGGHTYQRVLDGSADGESMFMPPDTSFIICATSKPFSLLISEDHGETWQRRTEQGIDDSLVACSVYGIKVDGHFRIFVGCSPPLLLVTDDTGRTFRNDTLQAIGRIGEMPQIVEGVDSSELYACIAFAGHADNGCIYHSTNSGLSWKKIKSPTSLWSILPDKSIRGRLWAGQYYSLDPSYPPSSILATDDYGKNWYECGGHDGIFNWMLRRTPDGRSIILASEKGLFKSVLSAR
jgi:hypothetical protein